MRRHPILQAFIIAALLLALPMSQASADVIYFNKAGRAAGAPEKLFGVVRSIGNDDVEFQYYSRTFGWKWPVVKIKPKYKLKWIERIENEVDTRQEFIDLVKAINKQLSARDSKTADVDRYTRATITALARLRYKKAEPDEGTAEWALAQLKTMLRFHRRYVRENNQTQAFRDVGDTARRSLVAMIDGGRRGLETPGRKLSVGEIDPRLLARQAIRLVPEVTWNLDYKDMDRRSQFGELSLSLFNVVATYGPYRNGRYPSSMDPKAQGRSRLYDRHLINAAASMLLELSKHSETPVQTLVVEFSRNATHSTDSQLKKNSKLFRKQIAAVFIAVSGNTNHNFISTAVETLISVLRAQPKSDKSESNKQLVKPKQFELTSLYEIIRRSSFARTAVNDHIALLRQKIANETGNEADKRLLSKLNYLMRYYDSQASASQ